MQLHISIGSQSKPELEGGAGRGEGEILSVNTLNKKKERNEKLHTSVLMLTCLKDLWWNFIEPQ